ncbi:MAG: S8 family serine peptidase [Pseudolabrys sp.]|nr:S8 family serine peptidase [Pseudolabrys sp.]MDP2294858.1 S8 family serine peptidase [Pseudolabrys sp.]
MRAKMNALLCLGLAATLGATLTLASPGDALAQKYNNRGTPGMGKPSGGGYPGGGGSRGPGWGAAIPGIIMVVPHLLPRDAEAAPGGGRFIDDGDIDDDRPRRPRPPQNAARRGPSGAPPANERRLVPDEVVIELRNTVTPQQIQTLQSRHRLTRLESQTSQLSGTTMYRWRIPDRRSVGAVVRALEADNIIASAQPNYQYTLQQAAQSAGDPAQYELAKLRLPQAHALSRGTGVKVAVIDSGVDDAHAELTGSVTDIYNALATPMAPHSHGTAIAGLIAAHGKLLGAAPNAKILAVRAFDPNGGTAEGTTFAILKGLDWAAAQGARVLNMSFAGPNDPAIRRALEAAFKKGIVLIAAAGNAGAKSPPLYPAADVNVIAVSATDADDKLIEQSNRGKHIEVAAPGAQLLVATPDGYEVSSGTSLSAAGVSGIVALMLERRGDLTPAQVRVILQASARDLGPKGRDIMFGAGLADALAALSAPDAAIATAGPGGKPAIERVSTGQR